MRRLKQRAILGITALLACAVGHVAIAGEQVLEFKLVTMPIEVKTLEVPNVDGQVVVLNKMRGAAFFKDGRVASKEYIFSADFNKGAGPFFGYSTYQFEDGATITSRFTGTSRAGELLHGDYTVISGTGVYAGVKGSGSFDATPHKLNGAYVFNGKFVITTP